MLLLYRIMAFELVLDSCISICIWIRYDKVFDENDYKESLQIIRRDPIQCGQSQNILPLQRDARSPPGHYCVGKHLAKEATRKDYSPLYIYT